MPAIKIKMEQSQKVNAVDEAEILINKLITRNKTERGKETDSLSLY